MSASLVSVAQIRKAILLLRGQKVILDRDLAVLYGVPTKALKQAVKRNIGRFPEDFMFIITPEEFAEWRSQFVTSKADRSSATTSSCTVICTLLPAYFRTWRTNSGSRLLASLIEIFILTPGERQEECTALYTIGQ
jgi:hypothetical protein